MTHAKKLTFMNQKVLKTKTKAKMFMNLQLDFDVFFSKFMYALTCLMDFITTVWTRKKSSIATNRA